MSYAGSLADRYRNAAPSVDNILKAQSLLTCRLSSRRISSWSSIFKTAKALGLTFPPDVSRRAPTR